MRKPTAASRGPVKLGGTDFERLFGEVMSEETEVRVRSLSELGQNLIHRHEEKFAKLLELFLALGEFDVTGWNKLAVEVVVEVCSKQNRAFRFKRKGKTFSIVRFPEGPMKELFVRDIVGEPW